MSSSHPYTFTMHNYQKERPFSSFLPGIAGKTGFPLWSFYVNRGQLISSFGIRDKNGAIMEFFPANSSYHHVSRMGFRTFIKVGKVVYEFFKEKNEGQTLYVRQDQIAIEETNSLLGIRVKVTYFTLPNESLAGLVRKVEISNLTKAPLDIEIIDGMAQVLPTGIGYYEYKFMSNLFQSWMESRQEKEFLFYTLRASTADSSEVKAITDGNYFFSVGLKNPLYISDYKLIFDEDTSLETPYVFEHNSIEELRHISQVHVNQVPCGMVGYSLNLTGTSSFVSVFGYTAKQTRLDPFLKKANLAYFAKKEQENLDLHQSIVGAVETHTSLPLLDAYFEQCYLDNVLRGGVPMMVDTLEGPIGYHLYSRKHGDPERDYNFFSIEPSFYSQGNGNFRDVLQNRRNDIFFTPALKDFNTVQFLSLIQADGYNPLGIEGVQFTYHGAVNHLPALLHPLLKGEFTPGKIAMLLEGTATPMEETIRTILKDSRPVIKASFGEGYWEDHFTYLMDAVESFLAVYPDELETFLFDRLYPYFVSPIKVLPRKDKYVVREDGQVRQYGALHHHESPTYDKWLKSQGNLLKANTVGKLLTLALNKFAHLDPFGIGLSYEAERPGWNDAMNGLPALFGSGVSETIELKRIVDFLDQAIKEYPNKTVTLLTSTDQFAHQLKNIKVTEGYGYWDQRMTHLESYREGLEGPQTTISVPASTYSSLVAQMKKTLELAIKKAKDIDIAVPTYLTYSAVRYEVIEENGKPKTNANGQKNVKVTEFKMVPLPLFLEGPARLLKSVASPSEGLAIYHRVKGTQLYDKANHFYQTSESLDAWGNEIGRIRAFTPGWLERESNFLHMTYKYLLGLLKAGLYTQYFDEIKTNYSCFMDPHVYGRPPIENCSFLATSSNPDPKKHGQGFVARLSGSTAEMLSMWRTMFFGEHPFVMKNNQLAFELSPKLPASFFKDHQVSVRLFNHTIVTYHNPSLVNTYDAHATIKRMEFHQGTQVTTVLGSHVSGGLAQDIRSSKVDAIHVYIGKGE